MLPPVYVLQLINKHTPWWARLLAEVLDGGEWVLHRRLQPTAHILDATLRLLCGATNAVLQLLRCVVDIIRRPYKMSLAFASAPPSMSH